MGLPSLAWIASSDHSIDESVQALVYLPNTGQTFDRPMVVAIVDGGGWDSNRTSIGNVEMLSGTAVDNSQFLERFAFVRNIPGAYSRIELTLLNNFLVIQVYR
ncbi:hypothetical protein ETB97_007702 [Aspergillus alliaceus]|uniref:Uncharacterized protein n=1 Tax=Petromyces alliaceus TaxID=209559 RepID=A0A8H6E1L1_PETAA|nr:hypothetical protein ETB97_007702 [Aspergillus burnettii]